MRRMQIILAFTLPILIFLFGFRAYVFNEGFYMSELAKHDVYAEFPVANEALGSLMGYLQRGTELDPNIYTEREILHMEDVRRLVLGSIYALDIAFMAALALVLVMAFRKDLHAIGVSLIAGSTISFVIALLAITFSMVSFSELFAVFHEAAFTNDLWLLPPESALIRMFPQGFFYDMAKAMLINSMYLSMFLAAVGLGVRYVERG